MDVDELCNISKSISITGVNLIEAKFKSGWLLFFELLAHSILV